MYDGQRKQSWPMTTVLIIPEKDKEDYERKTALGLKDSVSKGKYDRKEEQQIQGKL